MEACWGEAEAGEILVREVARDHCCLVLCSVVVVRTAAGVDLTVVLSVVVIDVVVGVVAFVVD